MIPIPKLTKIHNKQLDTLNFNLEMHTQRTLSATPENVSMSAAWFIYVVEQCPFGHVTL